MKKYETFSIALGGWAARGLAHIGIIEYLDELNIRPTMISGTSMGAVIWAFYAIGYTGGEMREITKNIKILSLIDFDMKTGVFKWKKIMNLLEKYIGNTTFSETKIPLKIIATDIDTGEKYIFETGKIIDAIRASISIPGVFRPYNHLGKHFVDGWITENLPTSVLPKGKILAISVQIPIKFMKKKAPWKLDFWTNGIIANSFSLIRRTIGIMMLENEKRSKMIHEYIISPKIEAYDIDYYDFRNMDKMIDAGYRAGKWIEEFLLAEK